MILIGLLMLTFAALTFAFSRPVHASAASGEFPPELWQGSAKPHSASPEIPLGLAEFSTAPPPPNQDPCLSCHISGAATGEWIPISRWFVFGTMGLILVFGIARNSCVWRTERVNEFALQYRLTSNKLIMCQLMISE
jgi:hypothetical protein